MKRPREAENGCAALSRPGDAWTLDYDFFRDRGGRLVPDNETFRGFLAEMRAAKEEVCGILSDAAFQECAFKFYSLRLVTTSQKEREGAAGHLLEHFAPSMRVFAEALGELQKEGAVQARVREELGRQGLGPLPATSELFAAQQRVKKLAAAAERYVSQRARALEWLRRWGGVEEAPPRTRVVLDWCAHGVLSLGLNLCWGEVLAPAASFAGRLLLPAGGEEWLVPVVAAASLLFQYQLVVHDLARAVLPKTWRLPRVAFGAQLARGGRRLFRADEPASTEEARAEFWGEARERQRSTRARLV